MEFLFCLFAAGLLLLLLVRGGRTRAAPLAPLAPELPPAPLCGGEEEEDAAEPMLYASSMGTSGLLPKAT